MSPYSKAQTGMAMLKDAVHSLLETKGAAGASNAEIGRALGIYKGHVGHEGHISRTILGIMESEEVVKQDKDSKAWSLR
tara:strand:- start:403 stop:639 length:237 start_codon:yes stop_codon:yes gene_type:complete